MTKTGITCSDEMVDKVAQAVVYAVADKPHGIFGVDMAWDEHGVPNPTEINISRFFTTILFFTKAGLNMPVIFKNLALRALGYLNACGIGTARHYPVPLHLQKAYEGLGHAEGDFPAAEEISRTVLSLPLFYGMTEAQADAVIQLVNAFS